MELGGSAGGSFSDTALSTLVDLQFSPWMQFSNTIQFDSVSGLLGLQSRFRWILRPGNDLFLVYAHNWIDDPWTPWTVSRPWIVTRPPSWFTPIGFDQGPS